MRHLVISLLVCFSLIACGGDMSAGIQVIGDDDNVQIDQDYSNYVLRVKGTLSAANFAGAGTWKTATVQISDAVAPIMCVAPKNQYAIVAASGLSGGDAEWTFGVDSPSSISLDWYVFDQGLPAQDVGPGISVYRANGALAFNSGAEYFDVVDVVSLSKPSIASGAPAISTEIGSDVAVCNFPSWMAIVDSGAVFQYLLGGMFMIDGDDLKHKFNIVGTVSAPNQIGQTWGPASQDVIVIDVSGL